MKRSQTLRQNFFILLFLISSIGKASPLTFTLTFTSPCLNSYNGSITAHPSGGTPPYSYRWSNGETTQTISGLAASYYDVTVNDAGTGIVKDGMTLTAPELPTVTSTIADPTVSHF